MLRAHHLQFTMLLATKEKLEPPEIMRFLQEIM